MYLKDVAFMEKMSSFLPYKMSWWTDFFDFLYTCNAETAVPLGFS